MPKVTEIPTVAQLRQWRDTLKGEWNAGPDDGFLQRMQADEDLYYQRFEVEAPYGKLAVKTGSAPADCDAAVDALVPQDIQLHVRPARSREKYVKQADLFTRWGKGLLHKWRRPKDVLRLIGYDQVIRSVGIARLVVDESSLDGSRPREEDFDDPQDYQDAVDDFEIQHRRSFPIKLERRNPRYTYWREDDDGCLLCVVESYETTVLEAWLHFSSYPGTARALTGRSNPNDPVKIDDIWYGKWRCILINDEPIFTDNRRSTTSGVVPHRYPRIPYIIAPFRELPMDTPDERYRGMLTNGQQLYPMESQALSMIMYMTAQNAWRTYIGFFWDQEDVQVVPGRVIPVRKHMDEYLELLQGEPVPAQLFEVAGSIAGLIERNGIAAGPRNAEGARSAQQVWAMQSVRMSKIDPAKQNLQELVRQALCLSLEIQEQMINEPLTLPVPGRDHETGDFLGEVTLRPEDIRGYYDGFEVSFGRRIDPAQLEQAKVLSGLAQQNWMPLKTSWEMSGLTDNPADWEDQLYLQAGERLPFIVKWATYLRLLSYYEGDEDHWAVRAFRNQIEQEEAQEAMQGAPGAPSPGAMQPPGGAAHIGQMAQKGVNMPHGQARRGRPPGSKRPLNSQGPQGVQ